MGKERETGKRPRGRTGKRWIVCVKGDCSRNNMEKDLALYRKKEWNVAGLASFEERCRMMMM